MREKNKSRSAQAARTLFEALKNLLSLAAIGAVIWLLYWAIKANSQFGAFLRDGILP